MIDPESNVLAPLERLRDALKQRSTFLPISDRELIIFATDHILSGMSPKAAFSHAYTDMKRRERKLLIHELARDFYPDVTKMRSLAKAIHADWKAYDHRHFSFDKGLTFDQLPASRSPRDKLLWKLSQLSIVLSHETIRGILKDRG